MALDFLAGCVGGIAGVVVGYPLDTIKVHLQTQDHKNPKYKGTWNCFTTIIKQESFHGLYRGLTSPMAGVAVVNAIAFGVYGNVQRLLSNDKDALWSVTIAGSAAGLAQSMVSSPMELAKTKMQLQTEAKSIQPPTLNKPGMRAMVNHVEPYKNPVDCLVRIHREEGIKGVYRGCAITVLRDVPSFGVYFGTYEWFYQSLSRANWSSSDSASKAISVILAGGLSGTASWFFTYPLDVVKTRIQTDGHAGAPRTYKGIADCFIKSYKNEGHKAFTRGLNSTVIRAFPTNAATFLVADFVFKVFGPSIERPSDKVQHAAIDNKNIDKTHIIFATEDRGCLATYAEIAVY